MNSYTKHFKNGTDLVQTQCGGTPIQVRNYAKSHNTQPSSGLAALSKRIHGQIPQIHRQNEQLMLSFFAPLTTFRVGMNSST
jgi:hypothetical protein